MSTTRMRIVKIGNSHGIRIPKTMRDQLGLTDIVEVEIQNNMLIVRAVTKPREHWASQFQRMAAQGDDQLLDIAEHTTEW